MNGLHRGRKWYTTEDAARRLTQSMGQCVSLDDIWAAISDGVLRLYFRPQYQSALVQQVIPASAWPPPHGPGVASNQFLLAGRPAEFRADDFRVCSMDPYRPGALKRMLPTQAAASFRRLLADSGEVHSIDRRVVLSAGVILENEQDGAFFQLLRLGRKVAEEQVQYCHPVALAWDDVQLMIPAADLTALERAPTTEPNSVADPAPPATTYAAALDWVAQARKSAADFIKSWRGTDKPSMSGVVAPHVAKELEDKGIVGRSKRARSKETIYRHALQGWKPD
ncbi:MAG: hypothetical protein ACN6PF_20450 [Achromobacter veterisilvae]